MTSDNAKLRSRDGQRRMCGATYPWQKTSWTHVPMPSERLLTSVDRGAQ